eukprot:scaffold2778_cov168-Amphora_coffeaeformis.AAC.1
MKLGAAALALVSVSSLSEARYGRIKGSKKDESFCVCDGLVTYKYLSASELFEIAQIEAAVFTIDFETANLLAPPGCALSPVASEYEANKIFNLAQSVGPGGLLGIFKDGELIAEESMKRSTKKEELRKGFHGLDGSSVFSEAWGPGSPNGPGEVVVIGELGLTNVDLSTEREGAFYKCCISTKCFDAEGPTEAEKRLAAFGALLDPSASPSATIGGNPDATFTEEENIVSASERDTLRKRTDALFDLHLEEKGPISSEGINIHEDFYDELTSEDLIELIGLETVQKIHKTFYKFEGYPVTWILLRKTTLTGEKCIQYHQDKNNSNMEIWLNEDTNAVHGGNLVFLNRNETNVVPIVPGAAVLHGSRLAHGVTPVTGTRYILVLGGHEKTHDDKMKAAINKFASSSISTEL